MSHAENTASPALHRANRTALERFRSPKRFAAMVAAMVPTTTGHRARDPSAIRTPADTPAAGQKTATSSGFGQQSKAKPRCYEIYDADRDSEPNRANPPRQVDAGEHLMLHLPSCI